MDGFRALAYVRTSLFHNYASLPNAVLVSNLLFTTVFLLQYFFRGFCSPFRPSRRHWRALSCVLFVPVFRYGLWVFWPVLCLSVAFRLGWLWFWGEELVFTSECCCVLVQSFEKKLFSLGSNEIWHSLRSGTGPYRIIFHLFIMCEVGISDWVQWLGFGGRNA